MAICHHISALEEYCHHQAGILSEDSNRWLFINLLDELTMGYVARKTISGSLDDLDDVLKHRFWVFGIMDDGAYYAPFSVRSNPISEHERRKIKNRIRHLHGWTAPIERAADIVSLLEAKTIAAISFGRNEVGGRVTVLYWHPFFTEDIAIGLLKETVQIDDTL